MSPAWTWSGAASPLPFLASPLLDEPAYRYTEYNRFPDEYIVSEPALPGFDRAVLAAGNRWPGQKLFLQAET